MKIAIFGGTHGNELVGVEVVKALRKYKPLSPHHTYETFIGNPKAIEHQTRYIDSDLNRAFGKNARPHGYEATRAQELESEIRGKFDLIIDLHTTTTNMGLTAILNNSHPLTQQTCCLLKSKFANLKLIQEIELDDDCCHLGRLAPAGVTIEVGPVANNVISGKLVKDTYDMITRILNFDFKHKYSFEKTEVFKTIKPLYYPEDEGWFIHPDVEGADFMSLKPGDPLFINILGETINFNEKTAMYPFFINEAAYLEHNLAMLLAFKAFGESCAYEHGYQV